MAASPAERQIILLSAGTSARRVAMRGQARRLLAAIDWPQLTDTLRYRKLLPVLGPRILELAEGLPSEEFAVAVDQAIEAGRRQGAFLQLVSMRVTSVLAAAGITSVPLKGPLLSEAIYGDPGRRLSGDIDLLVAPEQLNVAVEVVQGLGYDAPNDRVEANGLPRLHFALAHLRDELPPVELHWRIHWYEQRFAHERLLPPSCDRAADWHPALADQLAALLLFYARDGFVDLRLAADLSAWWDVFGSELRLGALDEVISSYPDLARAIPAALQVAEMVVGLPAAQILERTPMRGIRNRLAVRLANPNPQTSQAQLYADMGLIDALLMPLRECGAFIRRQVVLPREVFDDYAVRASDWRATTTVGYSLRVLARYGMALTKVVRGPEQLGQ
jgi:Uncharacterised nucleotidyltransferase